MLTRSTRKKVNETSQEDGRKISTEETAENEGVLEDNATKESLSSPKDDSHSKKQNELHLVSASETSVVVNREENQTQEFRSPIFNIHIHVPPSNSDGSSTPPTVQPIIHLHFDETNKNHDGTGRIFSQNSLSQRRVENFLCMTSTETRNACLDFSECSDITISVKGNSCSTPNQNGIRKKNDTDVDMSDLSNISSSEISTECRSKKVTQNKVPVAKLVDLRKQKAQKRQKSVTEVSSKREIDKDFKSVFPKLQSRLKNLIKKNIQKVNTTSYNKLKKKMNSSKCKPLMQYQENSNINLRQLRSGTSEQQTKPKEPEVIVLDESDEPYVTEPNESENPEEIASDSIQEAVVVSDADTPAEKCNKEEKTRKKKNKKKSNTRSTEKDRRSDSDGVGYRTDGTRKYRSAKTNAKFIKEEGVKTRESIDRKCKTPSREQHLNWVKKVAFAKACQLQPTVFAEKEIIVESPESPVKTKKAQKLKKKSKTLSESVKSNKKTQQDDGLGSCETPKRISREISNAKATSRPGKRQDGKDLVLDSENESNEEIFNSKKTSKLKSRSETSSASVNSDEETQENGSSQLQSNLFTDDDSLEGSPINSIITQDLQSRWEALLASGNSSEETQQNDRLGSCETPVTLSFGCQLEPSVLAKKEVLEKSPVNSISSSGGCQLQPPEEETVDRSPVDTKKAEELKNKWVNAFASVNTSARTQQNGSLVSCETPKRLSSYQHIDKRSSREISDVESSPKTSNSLNKRQASNGQALAVESEEICTLAPTSYREKSSEASNSKALTLLAGGCNFSEILQKFREKHYRDKVSVFFPDKSKSNDDHIPQDSDCIVKESLLDEDELEGGDVSHAQTVNRKKEKEKSDEFINENKADQNSNPSLKEPVNCCSSATEKPTQSTHSPASPRGSESFNDTNRSPSQVPVFSSSNRVQLDNETNLNCDGENKDFEKISDGIDVNESCYNSSLTGNGTTPEKNVILQEDNHEIHDSVNEFRAIKKKLLTLAVNKLSNSDSEKNNDTKSSNAQLESLRKELLDKCMAKYSSGVKQPKKKEFKLKTKRKGSQDSSMLEKGSSPAKKMKESKEKNINSEKEKSSKRKVFTEDDYIPLEATGPTKFAVAQLDKVIPCREHAAKDFKGNMLYGNRVKRFSSPKSLEIYKTKQKASKKSSH